MEGPLAPFARLARALRDEVEPAERAAWGQVLTPAPLAEHLASWLEVEPGRPFRILDPGAGAGMLGAAAALHALGRGASAVDLVAVEREPRALAALREGLGALAGVAVRVVDADFLVADLPGGFDAAVGNPPWRKLSPSEPRGGDAPNAYARFMERALALLRPGGQLAFAVPRSYTSGPYFARFRARLHASATLERVHLFTSRSAAFAEDKVLQEVVLVGYRAGAGGGGPVNIGASAGVQDFGTPVAVPRDQVLAGGRVLLPADAAQREAVAAVGAWTSSLGAQGLAVSTGPVVPFRTDGLREAAGDTVPLLWMHHVRPGAVRWPLGAACPKPEHHAAHAPEPLRWPRRTAVLVRRISAVEDRRRLTAGVLWPERLPGAWVGLENHLNVLHRPGADLTRAEALGLAALLSTRLVDLWMRASSGSTQVNAADLRALPLPPARVLIALGEAVDVAGEATIGEPDALEKIWSSQVWYRSSREAPPSRDQRSPSAIQ